MQAGKQDDWLVGWLVGKLLEKLRDTLLVLLATQICMYV